ncbi:hypothetical protein V0U79_05035 [Hyphobacterium sp. HN65]|uniref:Uncharacterized protein n=1 Tax=Hyphobacterium lacteum TaxID=3116575 RepID=A0ABU7LP98_9PROT|nr:hypothetical protein [Hyphobacterium sp. HN65]MEE2525722.1 hypothetical protein [Hyphobacterium sp. HN65]
MEFRFAMTALCIHAIPVLFFREFRLSRLAACCPDTMLSWRPTMHATKTVFILAGFWLLTMGATEAFQQSAIPTGPSNGGFGFECTTHTSPAECTCLGDEDCDAMAALNVCEQIPIVSDGEHRWVDAMICNRHPSGELVEPTSCHCDAQVRRDLGWRELYRIDSAFENAPRADDVVRSGNRDSEVVPARRGTADQVRGEAPQAQPSRRTRRDHRDDN